MKRAALVLVAIATVSGIVLVGRRGKAASGPSAPANTREVDGKLSALALGAEVIAGGTWVIVASDEAHRGAIEEVVRRRAAAHPAWQYVVIDLELARELAADRAGVEIPAAVWGGVAAVKDGELVTHSFFAPNDALVDAESRIDHAETMTPQLAGSAVPSVAAGLLVTGPSPAALPPVSPRGRLRQRLGLRRS